MFGTLNPVDALRFIFHFSDGLNTKPALVVNAPACRFAFVNGNLKNEDHICKAP